MVMTGIPIPGLLTLKQTHDELKVKTLSPLLSAFQAPGRELNYFYFNHSLDVVFSGNCKH